MPIAALARWPPEPPRRGRGAADGGPVMYVCIDSSELAGAADEAVRGLRDHVVPQLQGLAGLHGFCAFASENGSTLHAVSLLAGRAGADEVRTQLRRWREDHAAALLRGEPEQLGGEAVFHEVADPRDQHRDRHRSLFAAVRRYRGLPGQTETMHSLVSERTLPLIQHAEGFRGFYSFRDEGDPDQAISLTLFDAREEALRTHEAVLAVMRERLGEMAYDEPTLVMGETGVLVTA